MRLKFDRLEVLLSRMPHRRSLMVAWAFRSLARAGLAIAVALVLAVAVPFWLLAGLLRMHDADSTDLLAIAVTPSLGRRRVVIALPDWKKSGSTAVFASQVRAFDELGWQVDLIVFSDLFQGASRSNAVAEVMANLRRELPIPLVSAILLVRHRTTIRRVMHLAKTHMKAMPPLEAHCLRYAYLNKSLASISRFVAGADLVISNRVSFVEYLRPAAPVLYLETHDVLSETIEFSELGRQAENAAYERTQARRAEIVGCYTRDDEKFFRESGARVIQSRFAISQGVAVRTQRPPLTLLYVGARHQQNALSLRAAWSHLDEAFTLLVAGKVCDLLIEEGLPSNVELLGFVEDLGPLLARADIVVLPDFSGTGISVKTIEALQWGRPLFGTRRAFRGLEDLGELPAPAIASDDPAKFFAALSEHREQILGVDWTALRTAVAARYSPAASLDWAREAIAAANAPQWGGKV